MSKFEELYSSRFVKTEAGCWEWQGGKTGDGYGIIRLQGKQIRVHRLAYTLDRGPIGEGLFVCHSCDNPKCCNPDHLWLGTSADNIKDCISKGRWTNGKEKPSIRGELHGYTNLTNAEVIRMRQIREEHGTSYRELGRMFNCDHKTALRICKRMFWKHI
jgi:hypothetical protein